MTGGEEKLSGSTMLIDSVVTPVVTRSEQSLHHAITELELIACGRESGKWTDGLQKTSVWPDLVSVQATSSKAVDDTTTPTSWPN